MIVQILKGWVFYLFGYNDKMAHKRLNECNICPAQKKGFCGECGCFLHAKTRLKGSICPMDKWQE